MLLASMLGGCAKAEDEKQAGPINASEALALLGIDDPNGVYSGTMTMTKVEVVYDTEDLDEEGNIQKFHEPEGTSEWLGTSVEATLEIELDGNLLQVLNATDKTPVFEVDYDPSTGEWLGEKEHEYGRILTTADFSKTDDQVKVKIVMTETHEKTEVPDGVNETTFELIKRE